MYKLSRKCHEEIGLKRSAGFIIHAGSKRLNIYAQLALYLGESYKVAGCTTDLLKIQV